MRYTESNPHHQFSVASGDCLTLRGIQAAGIHGVLDFEHHQPQDFVVDVALWFDSRNGAYTDQIAQTVNYAGVTQKVIQVIGGQSVALIERLAHRIAISVLEDQRIQAVQVTVHKPQAPLPVKFADVSIQILRTREDFQAESRRLSSILTQPPQQERWAVLALGANLGDPVGTLRQVVDTLRHSADFTQVQVSPLARTRPVLAPDAAAQPDYYNAVVRVKSRLSAIQLLRLAQDLEDSHGRIRPQRWAPRTLDIDVISIDGVKSGDPRLTLPHPRASGRAFVLVPWMQLDPGAQLEGIPVSQLANLAQDREGIVNLWPQWLDEAPDEVTSAPSPDPLVESQTADLRPDAYGLPSWQAALNSARQGRIVDETAVEIIRQDTENRDASNRETAKQNDSESLSSAGEISSPGSLDTSIPPNSSVATPTWHSLRPPESP